MSDVIARNLPMYYELSRIAFQLDEAGAIVAVADMAIRNADGQLIDNDHPAAGLTTGEEAMFLDWVLAKLDEYEDYTESVGRRLTRWAPPVEQE